MAQGLIFVVAVAMMCLAPGVHATSHLTFANNTQITINREGCGVSKLCVETPNDCDPSGTGDCLFTSIVASKPAAPNGFNLSIKLRGKSTGYIALGLTTNPTMGITIVFLCGNLVTNNRIFFMTMQLNKTNKDFTSIERTVTGIYGTVTGDVIRCEFMVPSINATNFKSSHESTLGVYLGNGTLNGTTPGKVDFIFNGGMQNLSNPASNVGTTAAPGSGASGASQSNAVPILLGVLAWLFSLWT